MSGITRAWSYELEELFLNQLVECRTSFRRLLYRFENEHMISKYTIDKELLGRMHELLHNGTNTKVLNDRTSIRKDRLEQSQEFIDGLVRFVHSCHVYIDSRAHLDSSRFYVDLTKAYNRLYDALKTRHRLLEQRSMLLRPRHGLMSTLRQGMDRLDVLMKSSYDQCCTYRVLSAKHCNFMMSTKAPKKLKDKGKKTSKGKRDKALSRAAATGEIYVVMNMLNARANPNEVNSNTTTPLHHCGWNGYSNIAELLIERNAEVNKTTRRGFTPLHFAYEQQHFSVIKLLIEKGADPWKRSSLGQTPKDMAQLKKGRGGVEYRERVKEEKKKVVNKSVGAWSRASTNTIIHKVLGIKTKSDDEITEQKAIRKNTVKSKMAIAGMREKLKTGSVNQWVLHNKVAKEEKKKAPKVTPKKVEKKKKKPTKYDLLSNPRYNHKAKTHLTAAELLRAGSAKKSKKKKTPRRKHKRRTVKKHKKKSDDRDSPNATPSKSSAAPRPTSALARGRASTGKSPSQSQSALQARLDQMLLPWDQNDADKQKNDLSKKPIEKGGATTAIANASKDGISAASESKINESKISSNLDDEDDVVVEVSEAKKSENPEAKAGLRLLARQFAPEKKTPAPAPAPATTTPTTTPTATTTTTPTAAAAAATPATTEGEEGVVAREGEGVVVREGEGLVAREGEESVRQVYTPTRAEAARGYSIRYPPPESARGGRQTPQTRPQSARAGNPRGGSANGSRSRLHSARRPRVVDWHSQGEQYEQVLDDQDRRRIRSQERPSEIQWRNTEPSPFR